MMSVLPSMVKKLSAKASYERLRSWQITVTDWINYSAKLLPEDLGPSTVRSIARLTMEEELYTELEQEGALGGRPGDGQPGVTWA